jgi:hypothetical protein
MIILFISSLDERKYESAITIRRCRVGTLQHMTSQGDGRNLIYFQTYDFEFCMSLFLNHGYFIHI